MIIKENSIFLYHPKRGFSAESANIYALFSDFLGNQYHHFQPVWLYANIFADNTKLTCHIFGLWGSFRHFLSPQRSGFCVNVQSMILKESKIASIRKISQLFSKKFQISYSTQTKVSQLESGKFSALAHHAGLQNKQI